MIAKSSGKHKIPAHQFSISIPHRWVGLVFILSDSRSHTGSSEVNPQGPSHHAPGATKWNKRWSFKASEKICELFQVASSRITELYIRSQAGVINRATERDHASSLLSVLCYRSAFCLAVTTSASPFPHLNSLGTRCVYYCSTEPQKCT